VSYQPCCPALATRHHCAKYLIDLLTKYGYTKLAQKLRAGVSCSARTDRFQTHMADIMEVLRTLAARGDAGVVVENAGIVEST